MKRTLVTATIITLAFVLCSVPSISAEKEIRIGHSSGPDHVYFYFSVPVTNEMMTVIRKQEGVASAFADTINRYNVSVSIGKMFSANETRQNIIKALETEIFAGNVVKVQPVK